MANLFSLSREPFAVCYCFREPIKTSFLDACQMIAKRSLGKSGRENGVLAKSLSLTSQSKVESRINRAENA